MMTEKLPGKGKSHAHREIKEGAGTAAKNVGFTHRRSRFPQFATVFFNPDIGGPRLVLSVDRGEPEGSLVPAHIGSCPLVAESHENGIGRQVYPAAERDGIKGAAIGGQSDFFEDLAVFIQKYRTKLKAPQVRVAHDQRIGKPDVTRQVNLPLVFRIAVFDAKVVAFPPPGVSGLLNGEAVCG